MSRHDTLTLETMAPDLALLDCEWPDAALALRDVFTAFADPNSLTSVTEQRLVIAVRFADHWSVHTNKYRYAADLSGLEGFSSRGHQKFWRPRPWKHADSRHTSTA